MSNTLAARALRPRHLCAGAVGLALALIAPGSAMAFDVDDRISHYESSGSLTYGSNYGVDWRNQATVALSGYTSAAFGGSGTQTVCVQTQFQGAIAFSRYNSTTLPIDWSPYAEQQGYLSAPPVAVVPGRQSIVTQNWYCTRIAAGKYAGFTFGAGAPVIGERQLAGGALTHVWVRARAWYNGRTYPWTSWRGAQRGGR